MELTLTCKECGHEEHGESAYEEVIAERMRWHLDMCHPDLSVPFGDAVAHHREDMVRTYV
jgi:hypothetical protein